MRWKYLISFALILSVLFCFICHAQSENEVSGFDLESIKEEAENNAEKLNIVKVLDFISSNIISYSKVLFTSFSICLAVILCSSVFSCIANSFSGSDRLFSQICSVLMVFSCFAPLISCFNITDKHLASICSFLLSFAPAMTALYAASGNTFTSAVSASTLPAAVSAVQFVCVCIILPCIKAAFALTGVNTLCKKTNISGFVAFLKSFCLWIIGLSFTLFTGILSLQTILQSGADNLAMKGIKYGASRLIPIAGGMLSESMKTVITSMNYIKGVSGISGIIFILYAVIPPLCVILMTKFVFSVLSAFSKSAGMNETCQFIDGISSCLNILSALTIGCSVSFIIMLTVFIKTVVTL